LGVSIPDDGLKWCADILEESLRSWKEEVGEDDERDIVTGVEHMDEDAADDVIVAAAADADAAAVIQGAIDEEGAAIRDEGKEMKRPAWSRTVKGPDGNELNRYMLISLFSHNDGKVKCDPSRLRRVQTKYDNRDKVERMPSEEVIRNERRIVRVGDNVVCVVQEGKIFKHYVGAVSRIREDKVAKAKTFRWFDLRTIEEGSGGPIFVIKFLRQSQAAANEYEECNDPLYLSDLAASTVLFRVSLQYDSQRRVHILDEAYGDVIEEELEKHRTPKKRSKGVVKK